MTAGYTCVCILMTFSPITYHREPTQRRTATTPNEHTSCYSVTTAQRVSIECTIQSAVSRCYYLSFYLLCLLSLLRHRYRTTPHGTTGFIAIYELPQTTQGHNIFVSILRDRDSIGTIHKAHRLHAHNTLNSLMFQTIVTSCILSQVYETHLARCTTTCLNTRVNIHHVSSPLTK